MASTRFATDTRIKHVRTGRLGTVVGRCGCSSSYYIRWDGTSRWDTKEVPYDDVEKV